ncbi:hypothetical protein GG344DRAFT_82714 [Lentinula edodes]|nr:hypothetical protein GG344DRAFT_82714 [Lentinula edodes]
MTCCGGSSTRAGRNEATADLGKRWEDSRDKALTASAIKLASAVGLHHYMLTFDDSQTIYGTSFSYYQPLSHYRVISLTTVLSVPPSCTITIGLPVGYIVLYFLSLSLRLAVT